MTDADHPSIPVQTPGWRPLAGLMLGSGVLHLVMPKPYESIVPKMFGDPKPLVFWSGLAEIACGAGLAVPRTRRLAGLATAARLPLQAPPLLRALRLARTPRAGAAG